MYSVTHIIITFLSCRYRDVKPMPMSAERQTMPARLNQGTYASSNLAAGTICRYGCILTFVIGPSRWTLNTRLVQVSLIFSV